MAIFKIKSKEVAKTMNVMVGVYLPQPVHSFLSLYCLANETSKTTLIKNLVLEWTAFENEKGSEELINKLIKKANEQYLLSKKRCPATTWEGFQTILQRELEGKDLDKTLIKIIINGIQK